MRDDKVASARLIRLPTVDQEDERGEKNRHADRPAHDEDHSGHDVEIPRPPRLT